MKTGIHPNFQQCAVTCVCGANFETLSIKSELKVEICSSCHPFFTGQQKIVDTEGRVDRFLRKYGMKPMES